MDGSATIKIDPDRLSIVMPEGDATERHITLAGLQLQNRQAAEQRLRQAKLPAALDYARQNQLNRIVWGNGEARLGIAASGKNWQALMAALDLLGIDQQPRRRPRPSPDEDHHALAARARERLRPLPVAWRRSWWSRRNGR